VNFLKILINNPTQVDILSKEAVKLSSILSSQTISKQYLSFITDEKSSV